MTDITDSNEDQGNVTNLNGLTVYPSRIQSAATTDDQEGGHNEADSIIVDIFLHTLAEVAVNVARRRLGEAKGHVED